MQRSSARVRVRWATSTWNVLVMTMAAISRAMAAKVRTNTRNTRSCPPVCAAVCSAATCSVVWTDTSPAPAGNAPWTASLSEAGISSPCSGVSSATSSSVTGSL